MQNPGSKTQSPQAELQERFAALRAEGRSEEALRVLEETPVCPDTLLLRAQALNDLGRFTEALAACSKAAALCLPGSAPHDGPNVQRSDLKPKIAFTLGFTRMMLQQWEEALLTLDALLLDAPDFPDAAWMRAGLLRQLRGEFDPLVLDAFDQAIQADSSNYYACVERADLLRALGRYEEAQDAYVAVRQACPDEALLVETTFKSGCVAMVLHKNDQAREAFQAVIAIAPDYPDAAEMLSLLS